MDTLGHTCFCILMETTADGWEGNLAVDRLLSILWGSRLSHNTVPQSSKVTVDAPLGVFSSVGGIVPQRL